MRHLNSVLILSAVLALSGCGTLAEGQTEEVTLATPGAYDAQCTLDNGVKYKMNTGEKMEIMRTHHDLKMDCYAPGNRHIEMVIPNHFNEWAAGDVLTGVVPGAAYDHFSGGLYDYPETLVVDFTGIPTTGFELPEYHDKDAPNPYKQAIEGYAPATPRVEGDSSYLKRDVEKRDPMMNSNPFATSSPVSSGASDVTPMPSGSGTGSSVSGSASDVPAMTPSKPNLSGTNAEALTRSANPSVFGK